MHDESQTHWLLWVCEASNGLVPVPFVCESQGFGVDSPTLTLTGSFFNISLTLQLQVGLVFNSERLCLTQNTSDSVSPLSLVNNSPYSLLFLFEFFQKCPHEFLSC